MKGWLTVLMGIIVTASSLACATTRSSTSQLDTARSSRPSQIAANIYTPLPSLNPASIMPVDMPRSTPIPAPVPTSNNMALREMQNDPALVVSIQTNSTCISANSPIPFRLAVRNTGAKTVYFYLNGNWLISINNSSLGPQLAPLAPTSPNDFLALAPGIAYIQEEKDLGLWALALGPVSGISVTPTGTGLPVGNYWITFAYSNDLSDLPEQADGTRLIPYSAWHGIAVSSEIRFEVVNDLSDC